MLVTFIYLPVSVHAYLDRTVGSPESDTELGLETPSNDLVFPELKAGGVLSMEEWGALAPYFSRLQGCWILVCSWKQPLLSVRGKIEKVADPRGALNSRRRGPLAEMQMVRTETFLHRTILLCLFSLAMVSSVSFRLIFFFSLSWLSFLWAFEISASPSDGHRHYQLYQAWPLLGSNIPHRWCFSTWTTLSNMTCTCKISDGWIRDFLIIFTTRGHFLIIPVDNSLVTPPSSLEVPREAVALASRISLNKPLLLWFHFPLPSKKGSSWHFLKVKQKNQFFLSMCVCVSAHICACMSVQSHAFRI